MPSSSSITMILIIAAVSLTIGYVAGWLISTLRTQPEEKKEPAGEPSADEEETLLPLESEENDKFLPGEVAPLAGGPEIPPGNPVGTYRPALRLWREIDRDDLLVEVEGRSVLDADRLTWQERQQVENTLTALAQWLGATLPDGVQALEPLPPAPPIPPVVAYPPVEPPKPPTLMDTLTASVTSTLQSAPKKEPPKSIVMQIDDVLQEMLAGTPLEDRKINLVEDPRKGVIVWVGTRTYEGIDSVDDPEVKKIIRAAVSEWERRHDQQHRRAMIQP